MTEIELIARVSDNFAEGMAIEIGLVQDEEGVFYYRVRARNNGSARKYLQEFLNFYDTRKEVVQIFGWRWQEYQTWVFTQNSFRRERGTELIAQVIEAHFTSDDKVSKFWHSVSERGKIKLDHGEEVSNE